MFGVQNDKNTKNQLLRAVKMYKMEIQKQTKIKSKMGIILKTENKMIQNWAQKIITHFDWFVMVFRQT